MKTIYLLFVILLTSCFNLFGQYYIGQDRIDQLKNSKDKSFKVNEGFKSENYKVYLEGVSQNKYVSDVIIGFDKQRYDKGETVTLTFSRTGKNSKVKSENIWITENNKIIGDGFEIEKTNTVYVFTLKLDETKKIFVHLKKKPIKFNFIRLGIGKGGYVREGRSYIIPYHYVPTKNDSINTIYVPYDRMKSNLKKKAISNNLTQTVTISGTVQYEDIFTLDDKPLENFVLKIFEAETIEDFQFINPTQVINIIADQNGSYNITADINENYYAAEILIGRKEGNRYVYTCGIYDGTTIYQTPPYSSITSANSPLEFSYTYVASTDLGKCAYIASRIEFALTTQVGGDNLETIQTLLIGLDSQLNIDVTQVFNKNDETNLIRVGTKDDDENYNIRDGNILHEYGHSLANVLANFTSSSNAGGGHYIDQKSNTNLAFSEGWADFWACTVLNDEDLYDQAPYNFQLDLSTVDKDYIYSITSSSAKNAYLPNGITIYDGPENEALVAAAFWRLKGLNGLSAVWNAMKGTVNDGTDERAIQNMPEYFTENSTLKNSFYTDADRAEELGFGRSFSYLNESNNLAATIPSLSDKTLIYLKNGTYSVSSPIVINSKSFGIYGMSLAKTILRGQANQNIISITNPNNDDNWNKISDMKFINAKFSVEALATGSDQPKLYMSRCYSTTGMNGLSLAGDVILFNNVFANNFESGLLINSKGSDREIYIYNNVIENCGIGLRFNNSQNIDISGYISNNIFYNNNTGIALVDSGSGASGTRHDLNFTYNAQYPYAINVSTGLNIANNIVEEPTYAPFTFYEYNNSNYIDGGLDIEQTYPDEAIFKDLSEDATYGTFRNWIGFWGGRQSYNWGTIASNSKMTINPSTSITGQNVWSGFVYIDSSTTINSGASVTIIPGTEIIFSGGTSLIANGVLNSSGNMNQLVSFKPESGTSPESWGTIKMNGSGASGSVIKYANILYGTQVEALNVSNFEIANSNFTDNYKAVYVYNSSGAIFNNNITSSSIGHVIETVNGSLVDFKQNVIIKPNRRGFAILYGGGSQGFAIENDIYGCDVGIGAIWGSSTASYSSTYLSKNNRIRNCNDGLKIYRNSYAAFGSSPLEYKDINNSIYDNTRNVSVAKSYPAYTASLEAASNWWGSYPPDTSLFSVGANGSFIYVPPLSTDPWYGIPKAAPIETPSSEESNKTIAYSDPGSINYGTELRFQKKYEEAKNFFISYLTEHPEDQRAYVELYNCYSKETASDLINFFKNLPSEALKDHKLLLSYLYLRESRNNSEAERGKFISLAENTNNKIIEENPNTSLSVRAKINNIYIALFNENNLEKASSIFTEISDKTQLSTQKELADVKDAIEIYAGVQKSNNNDNPKDVKKNITSTEIPKEYSLLGNYPNPFNPSTTISYNLPFVSEVEVTIYDILGNEVKSFIIPSQNSGTQKIIWNGRNSNGEQVSSGIYLYHFKAKSLKESKVFEKSAKLILLR